VSLTGHHLSAVVWLAIDPLERVRRCTPRPAACCMLPPRCCPDACCVHHLHATTALLPRCMLRASCCPRAAACCPSPRRVLQQRFAHPAPDLSTTLHAPDFQIAHITRPPRPGEALRRRRAAAPRGPRPGPLQRARRAFGRTAAPLGAAPNRAPPPPPLAEANIGGCVSLRVEPNHFTFSLRRRWRGRSASTGAAACSTASHPPPPSY
jgi:hypothetical protein